jgi:hypothetical protein
VTVAVAPYAKESPCRAEQRPGKDRTKKCTQLNSSSSFLRISKQPHILYGTDYFLTHCCVYKIHTLTFIISNQYCYNHRETFIHILCIWYCRCLCLFLYS